MSDEQELTPDERIRILSQKAVEYRNECERLRNEINAMRRQVEQWSQAAKDAEEKAERKFQTLYCAAGVEFDADLEAERKRAAALLQRTKKELKAENDRLRKVYQEAVDRCAELESRGPSKADIETMRQEYNTAMANGLRELVRQAVITAAKQDAAKVISMLTDDIAAFDWDPHC
jgi:ribosomal protein L34E